MAQLTPQIVTLTGTVLTFGAATAGAGDTIINNDGRCVLRVKNGSGGSINVTADSTKACDQGFDHDVVVAVAAGAEAVIGPFPVARFGRTVALTYSAVTTVTVAVEQFAS